MERTPLFTPHSKILFLIISNLKINRINDSLIKLDAICVEGTCLNEQNQLYYFNDNEPYLGLVGLTLDDIKTYIKFNSTNTISTTTNCNNSSKTYTKRRIYSSPIRTSSTTNNQLVVLKQEQTKLKLNFQNQNYLKQVKYLSQDIINLNIINIIIGITNYDNELKLINKLIEKNINNEIEQEIKCKIDDIAVYFCEKRANYIRVKILEFIDNPENDDYFMAKCYELDYSSIINIKETYLLKTTNYLNNIKQLTRKYNLFNLIINNTNDSDDEYQRLNDLNKIIELYCLNKLLDIELIDSLSNEIDDNKIKNDGVIVRYSPKTIDCLDLESYCIDLYEYTLNNILNEVYLCKLIDTNDIRNRFQRKNEPHLSTHYVCMDKLNVNSKLRAVVCHMDDINEFFMRIHYEDNEIDVDINKLNKLISNDYKNNDNQLLVYPRLGMPCVLTYKDDQEGKNR